MRYSITSNLRIFQRVGKIYFPLGKIEFRTHWEFCAYSRIFGIRKSPEYLYQLLDVLPKPTTCEIKALQVYKLACIQQRFHDEQGAKFM